MKKLILTFLLLTSFSALAENVVTTAGKELHLTCVINFNPFFIELEPTHTRGNLYFGNRVDSEGRGRSREFLSKLFLNSVREDATSQHLVFSPLSRITELRAVALTIPKKMSLYMGKANQPARFMLPNGEELPGSCYVQFPAMPPQW